MSIDFYDTGRMDQMPYINEGFLEPNGKGLIICDEFLFNTHAHVLLVSLISSDKMKTYRSR